MSYIIKVSTNNDVSIMGYPDDAATNVDEFLCDAICCDFIEIVRPRYMYLELDFLRDAVMVIDESGLMKNKDINVLGSILYGIQKHGQPIVGDILIMQESLMYEGIELIGFDFDKAVFIAVELNEYFNIMDGGNYNYD